MISPTSEDAFDLLLREVENSLQCINKEGAKAFQSGEYDKAREWMDKGKLVSSISERLADIRKQWELLLSVENKPKPEPNPIQRNKPQRAKKKKLKKGLRTPGEAFRVPVLQALVELGGFENSKDVLDHVEQIMKPILNHYDYIPLNSAPNTPRWRNQAAWVRFELVREGLMASDSPVGVWEISEKGRRWLEQQQEKV